MVNSSSRAPPKRANGLPVRAERFEVRWRVLAGWAGLGRGGALVEIPAVAAAPYGNPLPLEHFAGFDFRGQLPIPFFMIFLSHRDAREDTRDFVEALFTRHSSALRIHYRVLVQFAGGGCLTVLHHAADNAGGQ